MIIMLINNKFGIYNTIVRATSYGFQKGTWDSIDKWSEQKQVGICLSLYIK